MKVLQNVKSELIVSIDIETVRVENNYEDLNEGFKSAWRYKNKQDGAVPTEENLAESWKRLASLYAEFSKICAVSLSYLDAQGRLVCKEYYGENEKGILEALAITLNNMQAHNPQYRLIGHASKYFDYPYTSKRYIINGLQIPNCLDTTALKPWEGANLCTNDLWKCGGTGAGSSLQALCNVLGVPISKVDLVGDEVGEAFYRREFERIGRYCSLDTVATFNVFRKFKQESIFEFESVNYITAYSETEPIEKENIEEQPLLQKINSNKEITSEDKEQLKTILDKKKITKKEKEIVFDLVKASLADIDQNFGAVKNIKQIDEIINQLKEELENN
jgi:hypothetical protein